jgi:hypothetical protein
VITPVPVAANALVSILLQLARMARDGSDSESLKAAVQFIQLAPCDMREYLVGLYASWCLPPPALPPSLTVLGYRALV